MKSSTRPGRGDAICAAATVLRCVAATFDWCGIIPLYADVQFGDALGRIDRARRASARARWQQVRMWKTFRKHGFSVNMVNAKRGMIFGPRGRGGTSTEILMFPTTYISHRGVIARPIASLVPSSSRARASSSARLHLKPVAL